MKKSLSSLARKSANNASSRAVPSLPAGTCRRKDDLNDSFDVSSGGVIGGVFDVVLRDQVDLHIVRGHLHAHRLHIAHLCGARCGICSQGLHSLHGGCTAVHHDLAAPTFNHLRQHCARELMQRAHHHVECCVEVVIVEIGHRCASEGRRCEIGNEDIDMTRLLDQLRTGTDLAQVAGIAEHLCAFLTKQCNCGRPHEVVALRDDDAFVEHALDHDSCAPE